MRGFFRYPGGKAKLAKVLVPILMKMSPGDYAFREPFFGGGAIGLNLLDKDKRVKALWINDFDPGIAALWRCVALYPDELKEMILAYTPDTDDFYRFKHHLLASSEIPNTMESCLDLGFKKLAIHQISYSGLGTRSGSPQGGANQRSVYGVGCRWSPQSLSEKVTAITNLLHARDVQITTGDFSDVIAEPGEAVIYADPPYVEAGGELYQHPFRYEDHERLANSLHATENPWVLSYDNSDIVRKLYRGDFIYEIDLKYSITATKCRDSGERASTGKTELLISNRELPL